MSENADNDQYVDAEGLLKALFPPASRPTVRWLRSLQKRRAIPFIKLGHLVRFDVPQVRQAIQQKHTVRGRTLPQ
jgi:hypothetical protein